jgi:phage-related minor tail protein
VANKRIQGITIKIGGDTTELGDALKETEKKSQSVRAELKEVGYSLRSNGESAVLWQQKQELLTKAIEESREKVKILEQAQDQIKEKFLNGEIDDGQYRAFQRELENARAKAKHFGSQLEDIENKIKELNGIADKTAESAHNLGNDLQEAGEQARNELVEVDKALKNNKDSVVLWQQKQELLSKAFDISKEKLNMLESAQRDVNKQLENKSITGEQYRAFQRELENARTEVKCFGGQLEEAEKKVEDLNSAADKTSDSAKSLGDELIEIEKSLKNNKDSVVLWKQKQELLSKAIEESQKKVKILEQAQDQIKEKFLKGEIDDGQYRAFQRELENARGESKKLGEQLEEAGKQAENLGDDIHKSGEQAQDSADGGFTVLKGVIADLASDALKAAADAFKELASEGEEALNTIQTRTGATAEEMQQYSQVMSNLYANNFGDDKTDLAESISSVKQQLGELSPEELEKITERALLMRDTFGYDVAESIRTVKMLMDQFEVSADEAYTLIAQGSQKGLDKNGDLLDTLNEYSVHYRSIGYSAEEFFNSLMNGTEAGTFSVDKLGDTVKEFSIRQKEGADETVAAWATLGLVQADNSEFIKATTDCIADQRDKIVELEKKLKYAYVEQSKFNSETDELKKMKMADSIAEWEQELSELQGSLAVNEDSLRSIQNAGSDAKYTAEELMSAFNSGGDEAQEATEDIINALFALEDETLKNQLGVQLFGTMWEDLGKDGVSALMDVSGEADKTASILEDINKVKYDDAQSQFEQLKRKIITDLLEPAAQKFIPKIEDGADWLVKNLPKLLKTGEKLLPVVKGIGGAFAAWKVAQKANEGASAIKKFNESLKHTSDSASASATGIAGISAALVTGAVSFVASVKKAADAKAEEIFKKATEESRNLLEAVKDNCEEMKNLKDAANETASQDKILMDKTEDLWNELQNLVDKNGEVKKGYEDRVEYIKGELTKTTGIEIELIDGQIQKYDELQTTIEETISKQRAQKLSDAYGDEYTKALSQMNNAPKLLVDASEGIKSSLKAIQSGTSFDYDSLEEWIGFLNRNASMYDASFVGLSVEEAMKNTKTLSSLVDYAYMSMDKNGGSPIIADVENLDANLENLINYYKSYNMIKESFTQNQFDVETYEKAEEALANKRYDEAVRLYSEIGDLSKAQLADSQKETEERLKLMRYAVDDALKEYNASVELGCKDAEKTFQESVKSIVSEAKKGGITSGDILKTGIVDKLSEIDGFDTTALRVFIESESMELGDLTGASIVSGVGNALNTLIEPGGAIISAINMARSAALSQALFPSLHGSNDVFVPMFAKGGFLGSGQGIVAEAGPELIEIMNGGARITPLTGNARNTVVSGANGAGGQKNFYSSYTINATIAGKYDVTRLAEDLEMERRRIEAGRGL